MKVKILELYPKTIESYNDDYYSVTTYYSVSDSTQWDEVSEEEFGTLKEWANWQNCSTKKATKIVIATETNISPPRAIKEYLAYVAEETKKRDKKEAESAAKYAAQQKNKLEKSLERKTKQLAKLQAELGIK